MIGYQGTVEEQHQLAAVLGELAVQRVVKLVDQVRMHADHHLPAGRLHHALVLLLDVLDHLHLPPPTTTKKK